MKQPIDTLKTAAIAAIVGFAVTAPAFAQTAANLQTGSGGVDLSPLLTSAISLLALVLSGVGGFAIKFLISKAKLNDNQFEHLLAKRLDEILTLAIGNAEMYMKEQVNDPSSPIKNVQFNNLFMKIAVQYAMDSMPGIIQQFGLTPERIADMIKSRLNAYVTV